MRIRWLGIAVCLAVVALGVGGHAADGPKPEPLLPVTVVAAVKPASIKEGDEIPLEITVNNGLKGEIAHETFRLTPNEWHGETVNISLVEIYRDGVKRGLFQASPRVEVPLEIAGRSSIKISPGKSLTIRTDACKWRIDGGWKPGKYEVTVRVERLSVDGGRCQLSVYSEPFEFEVK